MAEVYAHISTETMDQHEWVKHEEYLDELKRAETMYIAMRDRCARVEQELKTLQARCLHDFVNLLMNSIKDVRPTDHPQEVLRCLAVAVSETGPDELGVGECGCQKSDCPYK